MSKQDAFLKWIAFHLPDNLVCWCGIRIGAYAIDGRYANTIVSDVTFAEVMRRWEEKMRMNHDGIVMIEDEPNYEAFATEQAFATDQNQPRENSAV